MKKIRGFFIVLICIVLLNGCVKNTNTMTINKDKSMKLILYTHPILGKICIFLMFFLVKLCFFTLCIANLKPNGMTPYYMYARAERPVVESKDILTGS